jgi:hypothetical protein
VCQNSKARLQLLAAGLLSWFLASVDAYLIFIFLPFDFTLAFAGTVTVPGAGVAGSAVVVVDSTVVEDGVVSVVVPVMGEVVVVEGVVVVLRVVVVVVPVWALAE